MTGLRSIVYVSTAVRAFTEPELEALLLDARAFNRQEHVTGVLIYDGGNFMQCFEGPEGGVSKVYERIRESRRHTGIIELLNESEAARSFSSWEMGYRSVKASKLLELSSARWERQLGNDADKESAGIHLLRHFWRSGGR